MNEVLSDLYECLVLRPGIDHYRSYTAPAEAAFTWADMTLVDAKDMLVYYRGLTAYQEGLRLGLLLQAALFPPGRDD